MTWRLRDHLFELLDGHNWLAGTYDSVPSEGAEVTLADGRTGIVEGRSPRLRTVYVRVPDGLARCSAVLYGGRA